MWHNISGVRIFSALVVLNSLVNALPHFNIDPRRAVPSVEATEDYIRELERELEYLRWLIQANDNYQKANDYIQTLLDTNRQKV